jgi:hypothetical protein
MAAIKGMHAMAKITATLPELDAANRETVVPITAREIKGTATLQESLTGATFRLAG